ncbi:hypothetical protein HPP92_016803 [Vanilla planifolia]|uniref:Ribosomal protein L30 ferredoxin-like fold domain-containing protein n=1 Tax=Vanilla planifolia TaxID=51239 RepID=A0A835QR08_VANPL|nr:hypothetical protein HPP92_017433 [Vanilla planifolia]KAG0472257.1 hypothetical protein HPP92_016803 [Vanilla planifolia]
MGSSEEERARGERKKDHENAVNEGLIDFNPQGMFKEVSDISLGILCLMDGELNKLTKPLVGFNLRKVQKKVSFLLKKFFRAIISCYWSSTNDMRLIIEFQGIGKHVIICMEDLIHEIFTVGPHFKEANNFLWPFKLKAPSGGLKRRGITMLREEMQETGRTTSMS